MMDLEAMINPEILAGIKMIPPELVESIGSNPPAARAMYTAMVEQMAAMAPPTEVTKESRTVSTPDHEIPVVIYSPPGDEASRPGLLWLHGGGYIIGSADDASVIPFVEAAGCVAVSVDYRMAPEHQAPAAAEDAFAALLWMVENAAELGIDSSRIAIGGASAGGGLAASLALMNRDRQGPELKLQLLIYPMIDDTHNTASGDLVHHPQLWNRVTSDRAWEMYIGDDYGTDAVTPYGAATRATDLSGLPPAFITVGTVDLFRDEDIDYAKRLMAAGVPTELAVYPGMPHGGETFVPMVDISQRMRADYIGALVRALA